MAVVINSCRHQLFAEEKETTSRFEARLREEGRMKRIRGAVTCGAIVVLVWICRPLAAEESFFARWNPFRLFQRPAAKAETRPATVGAQSYGTPGPSWHADPQGHGDVAGSPQSPLSVSPDTRADVPATHSRHEPGGRHGPGATGRIAASEDGHSSVWVGVHGRPENGPGPDFGPGNRYGSFRPAGGAAGVSLGTGFGCR